MHTHLTNKTTTMTQYILTCDDNGTRWATMDSLLPLVSKGDIMSRTDDALLAVSVGQNGTSLVADSTQTGGMIWRTPGIPIAQPTTPQSGDAYFNATTNVLYVYNGTVWASLQMTV